jgi:DNA helicase-2/ATP-dependent DNA helicase PcrA
MIANKNNFVNTTLNSEQQKAAAHDTGPLLIVAGAGTGKTTVLIERLNYLIKNNLARPEEILIVTFTEKSAAEMEERADKILPYGYVDLWINTFHGFCERILRDHGLDIGLSPSFKLLSQTEQWILIKKNLDKFNLDYYRPLGNPTKFIHELIKHFSRLKDENISPAEYLEYAEELEQDGDEMLSGGHVAHNMEHITQNAKLATRNSQLATRNSKLKTGKENQDGSEISRIVELANAYHTYNQLLLDNGFMDFGDLICYTLKLFNERPNILKFYREKFKYIMVDEFQDTNWAQYELIKMLAAPKNNLAVVGDDDQAIYKFRGASLSNIMQFKNDYPGAQEVILTENYRSGQKILDVAYNFIKHNNPNRLEIKLGIDKKLKSAKEESGVIEHLHFETEEEETVGVVEKIKQLTINNYQLSIKKEDRNSKSEIEIHHPLTPPGYRRGEETSWSDFAILTRANDTADKFSAELTRRGIPNQFMSSRGLYYKPMILDCLAYLKLLDNYHESSALFRVLNIEVFKVSHTDIINLSQFARRKVWSLYEAMNNINAVPNISPEGSANINKLSTLIKKHSLLARQAKTSKVFLDFINDSGILAGLDYDKNQITFDYLNQFYQKIKKFETNDPALKLKDFMVMMEMEMEAGETGLLKLSFEDADTVKIMTVHAAKGLEFKYVFIVNLVDKKFPSISRSEKISIPDALVREKLPETGDEHIEEERRLFYVAMTRARDGLFLTSANDYGGARDKKVSKFLEEAGVNGQWSMVNGQRGEIVNDQRSTVNNGGGKLKSKELFRDLKEIGVEIMPSTIKYQLPSKFSFSQLEAFSNCPLQYKFSFILKVPVEEKVNFIFGRVIHSSLRDFLLPILGGEGGGQKNLFGNTNGQTAPTIGDPSSLLKIYEGHWQNDWYNNKEEREAYYKKGKELLKSFHQDLVENGTPKVWALEKDFNVKIGDYFLKGKIDRVDKMADGSYELIDYKTGKPKEKPEFQDKRQLIIYKIAVEEAMGLKANRLTFYYLENGAKVSFEAKEKEIEKVKTQILEEIEEIKQGNFIPNPSMLCAYCDFRGICEFRKT